MSELLSHRTWSHFSSNVDQCLCRQNSLTLKYERKQDASFTELYINIYTYIVFGQPAAHSL